jgi:MFS family permease
MLEGRRNSSESRAVRRPEAASGSGRREISPGNRVSDETARNPAQHAQAHFIAMAAAYALGVFNDNFFKQAALLIAIAIGRSWMQGWATVIFSLPFLIFAAQAGWLADRFPKRNIVISAKALELAAMICGAVGLCMQTSTLIPLVLIMLGVMGLQATILSPALNASIA